MITVAHILDFSADLSDVNYDTCASAPLRAIRGQAEAILTPNPDSAESRAWQLKGMYAMCAVAIEEAELGGDAERDALALYAAAVAYGTRIALAYS